MHICIGNLTIIGSDNDLSPGWRQAIIWANAQILLIGPLATNLSEILIEIQTFSFNKTHLKMSSGKKRPFCLGLNVLKELTWLYSVHLLLISCHLTQVICRVTTCFDDDCVWCPMDSDPYIPQIEVSISPSYLYDNCRYLSNNMPNTVFLNRLIGIISLLNIAIQIKICAEYLDMLPRPRLVCQEPGLRPIGWCPGVPDKSSWGLGSMSRYSAQILICFIAYIFLIFFSFLYGFG